MKIEVGKQYKSEDHGVVTVTSPERRVAGGYVCDVSKIHWDGNVIYWSEPTVNLSPLDLGLDKHYNFDYTGEVSKMLTNTEKETDMQIQTVTDWAIDHGYHEIETDTSDEFVAWQSMYNEDENGAPVTAFCGVKAWRDYAFDERFVAVLCWENGETYGQRGYGRTMLEALQDVQG